MNGILISKAKPKKFTSASDTRGKEETWIISNSIHLTKEVHFSDPPRCSL